MKKKLSRREFLQKTGKASIASGALLMGAGLPRSIWAAETKTGTLMNQFPTLNNQYWQDWNAGGAQAAEAVGIKYINQTFEDSVDKQLSQIENCQSLGVNMIFMFSQNAASSRKLISTAADLGILVVNAHSNAYWSTPLDPEFKDYYVKYIEPHNVLGSYGMCVATFNQIGGKGKVINLSGIPGNWSNDLRVAGVDMALKEFPDIELVVRLNGGENRVAAAPIIENLLTAHPDVAAVVCHNDDSAIAVLNALRERGMKKVKVGGVDAIDEFLTAMQKGPNAAASAAIHGSWLGGYAVISAFDALNGLKLDPVERMIYQDVLTIDTPESAKAYQEMIYRPKKLPFDWKAMSRVLNPDTWNAQNGILPINPNKFFWEDVVPDTQPTGWKLPEAYQKSIDAGNLEKYSQLYKQHFKGGPIAEVVALTSSKKTVLGFTG